MNAKFFCTTMAVLAAQSPGGPALAAADLARQCSAGNLPAVKVDATGFKDRTGTLRLELYPASEADFLKDDASLLKEGKTFRRTSTGLSPHGQASLCLQVPQPGQYAVVVIHDRDGISKFNIWKDGVALPQNVRLGRKRPKVDQALVTVGPGITTLHLRMQYMRGLSGFGPLKE